MKRKLLTLLMTCCMIFAVTACGSKEKEQNAENVSNENIDENNELETETKNETEKSSYIIETDKLAIVDYTKLEFIKTIADEPTEEEVDRYIDYLIESYSNETGDEINEENELTEEIIKWITNDEASTEVELREMSKETLIKYYEQNTYYNDLNVIYDMLNESSELKSWSEEELENAKLMEEEYLKAAAKNSKMDFETYKVDALGVETEDDYNTYIEEAALNTLKADNIIYAIAENESIFIEDEEFNIYAKESMTYYAYETIEELFEVYGEEQLKLDLLYDKVLDFIYNLY